MSIQAVRVVFESALPTHLKATMAALLTFGHNGFRLKPSAARLAWMVGKSERRVRADIAELLQLQVLVIAQQSAGGRGKTTVYQLNPAALPVRSAWGNHDVHVRVTDEKPCLGDAETMTPERRNHDAHIRGSKILIDQIEDPELVEMNDPVASAQRQRDRSAAMTRERPRPRRTA